MFAPRLMDIPNTFVIAHGVATPGSLSFIIIFPPNVSRSVDNFSNVEIKRVGGRY